MSIPWRVIIIWYSKLMEHSTICRCICFLETVDFHCQYYISLPEGSLPETNSSEDDSFPFGDFGMAKFSCAFAVGLPECKG